VNVDTGNPITHAGAIGNSTGGSLALLKVGAGTLALTSSASTYVGGTTLDDGTLAVSSDGSLGTAPAVPSANLTFLGGALRFSSSFNIASTRLITLGAGGGTIDTNGLNSTLASVISGTGAFTKTGSGTLTVTGSNTNSGVVNFSGGAVSISSSANLGNGSAANSLAFNGGTLVTTTSLTTGRAVVIGTGGGSVDTQANSATFSGPITGTAALTKQGAGTLHVTNLRIGGLSITGGVVHVLPSGDSTTSTSVLTSAPAVGGSSKFDLDDNSMVINYTGTSPATAVRALLV